MKALRLVWSPWTAIRRTGCPARGPMRGSSVSPAVAQENVLSGVAKDSEAEKK